MYLYKIDIFVNICKYMYIGVSIMLEEIFFYLNFLKIVFFIKFRSYKGYCVFKKGLYLLVRRCKFNVRDSESFDRERFEFSLL